MDRIEKIVRYTYSNSPFYVELMRDNPLIDIEQFHTLPIVKKEDFYKSKCPVTSMESIIGYSNNDRIIEVSTSGSTGKCLNVSWNINDFNRSLLPLWVLRKKYYNINPDDKMCYFYTISDLGEHDKESMYNKNSLGFSKVCLNEERIIKIYYEMLDYSPKWLIMQPSIAPLMISTAKRYGLEPIKSMCYVEYSGEILSEPLIKNRYMV